MDDCQDWLDIGQAGYIYCLVNKHYIDVIMGTMASQITSLTIAYSTVYSDADQRKHHSSGSLAFVWGIHLGPVNSLHKWPVMWKMFPFDDVIMGQEEHTKHSLYNCFCINHKNTVVLILKLNGQGFGLIR